MPIINVTLPSDGTTADVADYNSVITAMLATINGLLDDDNIASLNGSKIVAGTLPDTAFTAASKLGWLSGLPVPNTITNNGQGSYDLVFNGVDLTDRLSKKMRIRTTRSSVAPTQVTSLAGTKYWSKATPNKFSFTDDWAFDIVVKPTSYVLGTLFSVYNGTSGFAVRMLANGQVQVVGYNAGAANFSQILSNQSLRLNKEVRISGQLDMSSFTNTATTSYLMLNGMNIAGTVSRGGTNPVALVQAGNLNVGAENGGTNPFQGNISQLAIFNAKVTQVTMRTYAGQAYVGNETSLASAWSFNGVATDLNTTTPNDLSAQNAAGYATGGVFGNNGLSTVYDFGIVTNTAFSTNSTITVQVPEGNSLPTSSAGYTAIAYSGLATPHLFPSDPDKWALETIGRYIISVATGATSTFTNSAMVLTLPVGAYRISHSGAYSQNNTISGTIQNSTRVIGSNQGVLTDTLTYRFITALSLATDLLTYYRQSNVLVTSQETFTTQGACFAGSGTTNMDLRGDLGDITLRAEFGYL